MKFTEIERKFTVINDSWKDKVSSSYKIIQAYLSSPKLKDGGSTSRVRITSKDGDEKAFITFKENKKGVSRKEFENEIPVEQARAMIEAISEGYPVEKTRHLIKLNEELTIEIDEFHGENKGLLIAEIELPSENYKFIKPDFLGIDISDKSEYYNVKLAKKPFLKWETDSSPEKRRYITKQDHGKHFLTIDGKNIVTLKKVRMNDRNDRFETWQITQSENPSFIGRNIEEELAQDLRKDSAYKNFEVLSLDIDVTGYILCSTLDPYSEILKDKTRHFIYIDGNPVAVSALPESKMKNINEERKIIKGIFKKINRQMKNLKTLPIVCSDYEINQKVISIQNLLK